MFLVDLDSEIALFLRIAAALSDHYHINKPTANRSQHGHSHYACIDIMELYRHGWCVAFITFKTLIVIKQIYVWLDFSKKIRYGKSVTMSFPYGYLYNVKHM